MIEDRLGLDASVTQSASSQLLAVTAAINVFVRIPMAHFADKSSSKRSWLLWALAISFVNTLLTAFGNSLFCLFGTRIVQAIASSIMWIVGTTTVANNVPIQHIGKAYAMVSIATSVGFSLGPMLSGMLLQAVGYWAACSSAFCILSIDVVFRLLMVEKPDQKETDRTEEIDLDSDSEGAPFLTSEQDEPALTAEKHSAPSFYRSIFRKPNFIGGIYSSFVSGVLITSFNATLPLHVREAFHWGGMPGELMVIFRPAMANCNLTYNLRVWPWLAKC
ncbi:major facilitator superfamily domain-containing protein [Penicillium manginii]|uniref:major facilitator superfamily domain-containing protein n=1 Tax=Penicillium manginii TaxID=203109 RepID=UPI00254818FD|nr:major facilitator superfamily domain-containing protein [Penicillium manginii]KAJ5745041.1 major facilitator superfamily domain-containing protein [Penicillium manginii]